MTAAEAYSAPMIAHMLGCIGRRLYSCPAVQLLIRATVAWKKPFVGYFAIPDGGLMVWRLSDLGLYEEAKTQWA